MTGAVKPRRCILLFLRAPVPGRVKTRLERHLPRHLVVALYRAFVEDLLETIDRSGFSLQICYCPPNQGAMVRNWLGPDRQYRAQSGKDLGQRMAHGFASAFGEGFDPVLVLGSDLPDLPLAVLETAFSHMALTGSVIGPSTDGGYYSIGFCNNRFEPDIFSQIAWGSSKVLAQTLDRMTAAGLTCHHLPPWQDVDERDDLKALAQRLRWGRSSAPRTLACLNRIEFPDDTIVKKDRL